MLQRELLNLLRRTSDAALAVNLDGKICFKNEAAEQLFPFEELPGRSCSEVLQGTGIHGDPICGPECVVRKGAAERCPTDAFDMEIQTRQGRRWVNVSTIVAVTGDDTPLIIHLLRDVDIGKRLELLMRHILGDVSALTGQDIALPPDRRGPHLGLSHQETLVLRLLSDGLSSKEIAERLRCSTATVRNHIQHVFQKLSVHSRTAAVLRAIREHLA